MSNRGIFPNLQLIKKTAVERFLVATQEIYRRHPVYKYEDDPEATKVHIYPSYGNIEHAGKEPKLVVKAGGYNFSLRDTFYRNMAGEARNASGVISGFEHMKIIPFTINVLVQAYAEEESSDLADELAALIVFACKGMYAQVGMVTNGVNVSETSLFNPQENLFQTALSVSVDIPWETRFETTEAGDNIEIEFEDPLTYDTYRQPAANVVTVKG